MKKFFGVLFKVLSVLVALVCLVFAMIEGITLFSGDFLLHEFKFFGCIKYTFRFLLCLFGVFAGVSAFIKFFKDYMQVFSFTLLGIAFLGIFLFSNGFGVYFSILALVYFLVSTLAFGNLILKNKNS
jgi:hypothetical protein